MGPAKKSLKEAEPPSAFRIARGLPLGRHPILQVFPGLDSLPPGRKIHAQAKVRERLFRTTEIELVAADMWMYVAPREVPKFVRREWKPVISPDANCIVVGASHLRESPALTLYLDIYHELCHILQRDGGAELWEAGVSYVDRWTEVEAYRFVVDEARRLKVSDSFLREYLEVEWISAAEHRTLLSKLGVSVA
ncbi:MAG: hypothetical protein ACLPZM_00725 [Thermoplasmata archaeon]